MLKFTPLGAVLYAIRDKKTGRFKPSAGRNVGWKRIEQSWTLTPRHLYATRGSAEGVIKTMYKSMARRPRDLDLEIVEVRVYHD